MNKVKFGSYIKESRINKKYTQQELADLLFVDVTTVSKWERGVSYPDITLVPDICRVLEISEHELIASSRDESYRKMKKDARKFNNMKKSTFWTLNIVYAVALLTCFIVNVAVNKTLSWFFIVLSSITCAYTFCPTITWLFSKHKNLVLISSTFLSMSLLFLTCSIQTGNYWFVMATIGVLLGYFLLFYPILFVRQKKYLSEEKYKKLSKTFILSYSTIGVILLVLLLLSIYAYYPYNLKLALLITGGCFLVPMVFGILNLFEVTSSANKYVAFILLGVVIAFLIFGLSRALYLKNTEKTLTYVIEDDYSDIKVDLNAMDVHIYLSNDGTNKVVYEENKKLHVDIDIKDGVLKIAENDTRKFYDKMFSWGKMDVNLYLTQDTIDSLNIKTSTGNIYIDEGFTINKLSIEASTGNIEIKSLTIDEINMVVTTGDIDLVNVSANKLDVKISTGDVKLENTIVNGDFNMIGSTGDLILEGFDAENMYVNLSTGDVKGTILTSKIFNVKSKTGNVDVPETYTGGVCKIEVSTGNVIISYK